jgi:hypothetical protein
MATSSVGASDGHPRGLEELIGSLCRVDVERVQSLLLQVCDEFLGR